MDMIPDILKGFFNPNSCYSSSSSSTVSPEMLQMFACIFFFSFFSSFFAVSLHLLTFSRLQFML